MPSDKWHENQNILTPVHRFDELVQHSKDVFTGNFLCLRYRQLSKHFLHVGIWLTPFFETTLEPVENPTHTLSCGHEPTVPYAKDCSTSSCRRIFVPQRCDKYYNLAALILEFLTLHIPITHNHLQVHGYTSSTNRPISEVRKEEYLKA